MKKILLIMMCLGLIFACSKTETKQAKKSKEKLPKATEVTKQQKTKVQTQNNDGNMKKKEAKKTKPQKSNRNVEKKQTNSISPEITSLTVGNKALTFVYTEDLTKKKLTNECPPITSDNFAVHMHIYKIKKGEGEMDFDDEYFEEMENAVSKNTELPPYHFSSSKRLTNIDGYQFIEYITVSMYEATSVQLNILLCTTTPKNNIVISFGSDIRLDTIVPVEAPMYFRDSGMTSDQNLEGWGNKVPGWNYEKNTLGRKDFCKKLIAGTCESKTAQSIFDTYKEFVKSMKIE